MPVRRLSWMQDFEDVHSTMRRSPLSPDYSAHGQIDLDNSVRPVRNSVAQAKLSLVQEQLFRFTSASSDGLVAPQLMLHGHRSLDRACAYLECMLVPSKCQRTT
jgi:hypothetical protein